MHTPCGPFIQQTDYYNPYQVVWNNNYLWIDPYQQWFNNQGNAYSYALEPNHTYNVDIVQGYEYCRIEKYLFDPVTGEFIGTEVIGNALSNIIGADLRGTGIMYSGFCSPKEIEHPSDYYLKVDRDVPQGTDIIVTITDLTTGNPPINYHTVIQTPIMTLIVLGGEDEVFHYYSKSIEIYAAFPDQPQWCWYICGGAIPSSVTYTLQIVQGEEYGQLNDTLTGTSGSVFSGIESPDGSGWIFGGRFKFIADGIQPDSAQPGTVTIRCTPSDNVINTVEYSFPVKYNEYPPGQKVYAVFDTSKITPGDMALLVLMKIEENGNLVNFPESARFEVGMIEGCSGGNLLVDGSLDKYFYDVPQPILFLADSTILDTSITVGVKVGLIEDTTVISAGRPMSNTGQGSELKLTNKNKNLTAKNTIKEKSHSYANERLIALEKKLIGTKPKLKAGSRGSGNNPPLPSNPTEDYCFPGLYKTTTNTNASLVIEGDECDEEIVVCENIEPQTLSESSFVMLRGDKDYIWVDKNGKSHTSNTGNACLFDPPAKGRLDLGKCYTFEIIGNYTVSTDTFNLLDDALIKACLDQTDPNNLQWQFNIENLKIPVFADVCPLPEQYVDLIDGDQTKILNKVPNCDFYNWAVERLDYYIKGPYYQPKDKEPPYPIVFSTGILAHEDEHFAQTKREVIKYFNENETFKKIRDNLHFAKNETQSCPESATALVENLIKEDLKNAIIEGSNLHKRMGTDPENNNEYNAELLADKIASETYKTIKLTFKIIRSQVCN